MRKQFFLLVVIVTLGLGNLVFAADDIGSVSVEYCNNGLVNHAKFLVKNGVANEICLEITNESSEKLTLDYNFFDSVLSNNGEKACSAQTRNFGQFISFPKSRQELLPNSHMFLTGILKFPAGYSGDVSGCLAYSLAKKKASSAMFDILVRKIGFLEGRVVGEFERNEILVDSGFSYSLDRKNNTLNLYFSTLNLGDSVVNVNISGRVSNRLGFRSDIAAIGSVKAIGGTGVFVVSIPDIPFYKGIYYVEGKVVFVPAIGNYDITNFPKQLTQPFVLDISKNIFIIPWKLVVFVLLILGFSLYRKYGKKRIRK